MGYFGASLALCGFALKSDLEAKPLNRSRYLKVFDKIVGSGSGKAN
jgi:hypothetical protein